ncbi:hypothetical protein SO694_00190018 [Aureococcus anophagefferens]|uniref:G domain-containing protein n=1 Tax=Aureococcus anophagefferens TaxID=44056 RepID=A0ABR1FP03_AURAN
MGRKTGIVGLPNVGKSTLFNALTEDVIHVDGSIDPCATSTSSELELALSDLAQVEKRAGEACKDAKTGEGKAPLCANQIFNPTSMRETVAYSQSPATAKGEGELALAGAGPSARRPLRRAGQLRARLGEPVRAVDDDGHGPRDDAPFVRHTGHMLLYSDMFFSRQVRQ